MRHCCVTGSLYFLKLQTNSAGNTAQSSVKITITGPAGNIISTSTINIDFWFRHADFIDASPVGGFTVGRDTNYWGKVTGWEWNKKELCNSGITAAGTLQTLLENMVCRAVLFYSAQLNFFHDYYGCHQSVLHCIHHLFLN